MKILVSCVPFDKGRSGISVYIDCVVKALAAQGHDLVLVVEPEAAGHFHNYPMIVLPSFTKKPVLSMLYHLLILPFRIRKSEFDYCILTAANRRELIFYPVETAAVIHDLAPCKVKKKYDVFRMFYQQKLLPIFLRGVSHLFAISACTKEDMTRFWGIPPERITVNYNGLVLHEAGADGAEFEKRFGLKNKKYILYVSRLEYPGKNQLGLIQAFCRLPEELRNEYHLVLAGAFWSGESILREAAAAPEAGGNIIFTGFISNAELEYAYRNAAMYIFPSFYEGFGLSLLEAMHSGLPCACSNTSSLEEIGRGAALLFDPADPDAIADAMRRILTEEPLREELTAAGKQRASEFTWERHARQLCAPAEALRDTASRA